MDQIKYWKSLFAIHNIPFNYEAIKDRCTGVFSKFKNNNINVPKKYQIGGERELFLYNNKKIIMFKTVEDDRVTYSLKKYNKDEMAECLLIQIDFDTGIITTKENNNVAYIASVFNDGKCYYYESYSKIEGSTLIDFAIELIKSKRKEYGITAIYLKDNSDKLCYGISAKHMSIAYTLLTGHTWYGSKGFMPFDVVNNKNIYKYKELYDKNIKLNRIILVKHNHNLKTLIYDSYKKYKNTTIEGKSVLEGINTKKLLEILDDKFYEKYGNENLGKFLKYLLDTNLINCYIYFNFVEEIYKNISIEIKCKDAVTDVIKYFDFYGKSFYLDI